MSSESPSAPQQRLDIRSSLCAPPRLPFRIGTSGTCIIRPGWTTAALGLGEMKSTSSFTITWISTASTSWRQNLDILCQSRMWERMLEGPWFLVGQSRMHVTYGCVFDFSSPSFLKQLQRDRSGFYGGWVDPGDLFEFIFGRIKRNVIIGIMAAAEA